jgi:malonyl-CoA/methylmalonyl-CoA synthetase
MPENLFEVLRSGFPDDLSHTAIEVPAAGDRPSRVFSYAALDEATARLAGRLRRLGVAPGDRVAAQVEKSPEALFLYLACMRAGGVYLPLNTAYRRDELVYFLEDAEPALVVCDPAREAEFREIARARGVAKVATLDAAGQGSLSADLADEDPDFPPHPAAGNDLAALLYTSGTTGRPKGAMLSHRNLSSNAVTLNRVWGFRADDVLLHGLPVFHTHGLFVATNCALLSGATMLFLPRFDAAEVVRLLPRATVMMGVPTHYTRLLGEPGFDAEACSNMRLFISGSAPLLEETFHAFQERAGHTILERYGMTETGMNTSNPLEGARLPGSVGRPLPDVEARVVGPDGDPLPAGETGALEVKGPNVFSGYWRKSEKTAEVFRADGFFVTGDLARIDEEGRVSIVGRSKDLIISGGFNVYPKEVELVIDALEGISESAVIGLPHPDFGEAVAAVVVAAPADAEPDPRALILDLKERIAGYKVPKQVFFLDELPRNSMGKVQKNVLRERYAQAFGLPGQAPG